MITLDGSVEGVESTIESILKVEDISVTRVKDLLRKAAAQAKKTSSELAPTVTRQNKKTYKPRLPRSIRRRSSDQGMTHTIDINTAKAPHGYQINAVENADVKTPWRRENRIRMGKEGGFIEKGGDKAEQFLSENLDSFMIGGTNVPQL